MKKSLILFCFTFLSLGVYAQSNTEARIKASDPNMLYSNINFNAGIDFGKYENNDLGPIVGAEYWTFFLSAQVAIKDKFQVSLSLPISNYSIRYPLNRVYIDTKYKIFQNTNVFKSLVLNAGLTFNPNDFGLVDHISELEDYNSSMEFNVGLMAGIDILPKISVYPKLEYFYRMASSNVYINQSLLDPSLPSLRYPDVNQSGLHLSALINYDINDNNFLQLNLGYEEGAYSYSRGSNYSDIGLGQIMDPRTSIFRMDLKYQYAFSQNYQSYIQMGYRNVSQDIISNSEFSPESLWFRLGFMAFMD